MVELYIQSGNDYIPVIGSRFTGSGKVIINGGNITAIGKGTAYYGAIGGNCNEIVITGGTINALSTGYSGINCAENGSVNVTGGNILARGKNNLNIATFEEGSSNLVAYTPKSGTNNLYETQVKLQNVGENKKITKLTTSDGIEYGINDMYTLENGMLYLYLPVGTRTITIEVDGKTYSGTVQTTETPVEVTLSEVN